MKIDTTSERFRAAWAAFDAKAPTREAGLYGFASALAAALEAWEVTAWRPIEEARETFGKFATWDPHYGTRLGRVHVRPDHEDWLSLCDAHGGSSKGGIRPTHFRPLPPPPAQED